MIRLAAIDLDGTLLDSHWQVPEANRRAVALYEGMGFRTLRHFSAGVWKA